MAEQDDSLRESGISIQGLPDAGQLRDLSCSFYDFSAAYADKVGDKTFDLRLALGLARSFATSTRFIVDERLAGAMWLPARYLIEKVLITDPKKAQHFRLPVKEVFVG